MKYFIKTYGCKLNHSDSALMEFFLDKKYKKAFNIEEADLVIINTCNVVETTANNILKEAKELKKAGKLIIFGGCLTQAIKDGDEIADGILTPANIDKIELVAEAVLKGEKAYIFEESNIDKSSYLKDAKPINSVSTIVAISEGCLGSCTYCATKLARKKLISFERKNIILQIENLLKQGFKEIQLTSQDLAVYGFDSGKQELPELMKDINSLAGEFRVRLGMMNPGWAIKIIDSILDKMESDKFYKFLHIPLQSGNDFLLEKMQRGYKVEDFELIASKFRNKFADGILATDVIIGHPLETEEMFGQTLEVLKKVRPDIIHIFKFSKRPNTTDEKLKDWPDRIKKDRSRIATELFHKMNLETNQQFVGKKVKVLIIEKRNDVFVARMNSGRAVILKENDLKIGEFRDAEIIGSKWNYLAGKTFS